MTSYVNGKLVDDQDAKIPVTDRGFTLGDGLFETMRVKAGRVRRLSAHLKRLRNGARIIKISLPWKDTALETALMDTIATNNLSEGVLRLTLSRGAAARGLLAPMKDTKPTLVITVGDLPALIPATAIIACSTRRNEFSPLSRCKSLNFLDSVIARQEAEAAGANEALLLNSKGRLAEATVSNLFLVLDDTTLTPPLSDGALPGIMRATVIKHMACAENFVFPDALHYASEAFLTNSLGIRPLLSVDGKTIGDGKPGTVTQRLQNELD
ncbi:MAG: aminotransferase class IV [Proteobacteria bacterium]|nr:aminotransferase class IV [Pseudomonadota bacterium]